MFRPEDLIQDEIEHPGQTRQLQQSYTLSPVDQQSLLRIRTRLLAQHVVPFSTEASAEEMQPEFLSDGFNEQLQHLAVGQFLQPSLTQLPKQRIKAVNTWRLVALIAVLSVVVLSSIWYARVHLPTLTEHPGQPRVTPTTVPGQNPSLFDLVDIKMTSATIGWARKDIPSEQLHTIARTTDGGKTWRTFDFHGQIAGLIGHFFLDDQTAWVIMGDGGDPNTSMAVMRTTDGGQHWTTLQMPPLMGNIMFLDQQHGWAWASHTIVGAQASHTLYKTVDGGATWMSLGTLSTTRTFDDLTPGPLPLGKGFDLTFLTPQRGWAIVYLDQRIFLYLTQDAGVTWQLQQLPQPVTGPIPGIHTAMQGDIQPGAFLSMRTPQFFTLQNGILSIVSQISAQKPREVYLYETSDGGLNWSPLGTNIEKTDPSSTFILDTTHLLLVDKKTITAYVLAQDQWQAQGTSHVEGVSSLSFVNNQLGWVYTKQQSGNQLISTLYTTGDGGKSWHKIGQNITVQPPTQGG